MQYDVRHRGDSLWIVLRDKARPNSEVLLTSLADLDTAAAARASGNADAVPPMRVLLPHSREIKLEGISLSADFAVVFKREGGLQQASVHRLPSGGAPPESLQEGGAEIGFEEPAYSLGAGEIPNTPLIVIGSGYGDAVLIDLNVCLQAHRVILRATWSASTTRASRHPTAPLTITWPPGQGRG